MEGKRAGWDRPQLFPGSLALLAVLLFFLLGSLSHAKPSRCLVLESVIHHLSSALLSFFFSSDCAERVLVAVLGRKRPKGYQRETSQALHPLFSLGVDHRHAPR